MPTKKTSRREFLLWAGAASSMAILAACGGPQATPPPTATPAMPAATNTPGAAAAATPETAAATNTPGAGAEATATPETAAATNTPSASANATATAVAQDKEFDQSAPLKGLPEDPVLSLTEDQLKTKMETDLAAAQAGGKTVIEWLSAWGTILYDKSQPHYWLMKEFMEKNPDIYINYTPSTAYTGAFDEVIMTRIASGTPPDVIYHYSAPIAYAIRGAAKQLDSYMDADPVCNKKAFFEGGLGQCQWQGKTYGIACTMSPTLMYYNVDMLKERGLPHTRDTLPKTLDEAKALTAKVAEWEGDTLKVAGIFPWGDDPYCRYGLMAANGGGFWDGEKYSIDHPKNVELAEYWVKWLDEIYKGNIDRVRSSGNWGGMYPGGGLALGIQVMGETGAWGPAHCPPRINYELTNVLIGPSGKAPYNSCWPNMLIIPSQAKHPDEAYKFCSYASTQGAYWWWNQWADVPAWKEFPDNVPSRVHIARVGEEKARDVAKMLRSPLPEVILQWNSPVDNFATDEINRAVDEILGKVTDPKTALSNTQKAVQAKLDEVLAAAS